MNIVKVFRGEMLNKINQYDNNWFLLSELCCMALSYLQAKKYYEKIDFYVDEEGIIVLNNILDIKNENICLLPNYECSSIYMDKFYACSLQNDSFFFLGNNIILKKEIGDINSSDIIIHSINTNVGYSNQNWLFIDSFFSKNKYMNEKNMFSYNLESFGGSDYKFWKAYFDFIKKEINTRVNMINFPLSHLQFLLDSYLFNTYLKDVHENVEFLTVDKFRTHNLKSSELLTRHYQDYDIIRIPKKIMNHRETFKFAMENIRENYPLYYKKLLQYIDNLIKSKPIYLSNGKNSLSHDYNINKNFRFTLIVVSNYCPELLNKNIIELIKLDKLLFFVKTANINNNIKSILIDSYKYERVKYKCLKKSRKKTYSVEVANLFNYENFINELYAETSNLVYIVKTAWDWRLGVELKELYNLKLIYNVTVKPGRFETLFVPDAILQDVKQIRLDVFTHIVINKFKKRRLIKEVVEELISEFEDEDIFSNQAKIREIILVTVNFLLKSQVLSLIS